MALSWDAPSNDAVAFPILLYLVNYSRQKYEIYTKRRRINDFLYAFYALFCRVRTRNIVILYKKFLSLIALWHHFICQMIFVPLRLSLFRGYLCYYATNAFAY